MAKRRTEADLKCGELPAAIRLLDLATVVAKLDLSESSVFRRVREGVLPMPVKVGGGARWVEAELVDAIARLPRAAWAAKATGRRMSMREAA